METLTMVRSTAAAAADEIETEKEDETLQTSSSDIFTTLGPHFTRTQIVTRLDGPTLIAFSCASPKLQRLCIDVELFWQNICTLMWPSLQDPIVSDLISTFPGGYRSFFSDAFPSLHHNSSNPSPLPPPEELISTVDLYCQQGPAFFSKVERLLLNTPQQHSSDMDFSGVKVNALVIAPVEGKCEEWLKENMRLSWIVIDPARKRAANLSSCKPLWVQRNLSWSDDFDFKVVFGVMMAGEKVKCRVKVRCRWIPGENALCIRKVTMEMLDMNLWPVAGTQAFMIVQNAMLNGERKIFHAKKKRPKGEEASMTQFNYYDHVSIPSFCPGKSTTASNSTSR